MRGTVLMWSGDRGVAAMTGEGGKYAKAIFANVGKDVAIGYGAFFVIAMFVSFITTHGYVDVRVALADLLSGDLARG